MARKKKGNNKANSRTPRIREHTDGMLPEDSSSQPLSSPYSTPEASDSANNDASTAQQRVEWDNKGKGRADLEPSSSQVPESTSHDLPLHRANYQDNSPGDQRRALQQLTASSLVQYAPRQSLQDGPSGGFFEGSSNTEINEGKFNHTHGNQTNVEVHHHVHYDTPQQYPLPSPAASLSQASSHTIPSQSTQDIHRGQVPSMTPSEPGPSASTIIYSPDNSNKIYERHLKLKKRGFPLWIPEPNRRLPMCYRRKGVNIGDVGIITSSGAFSFLFNICVPHDDPINPPTLPAGFAPIHPPIGPLAICEYSEFKPESYLASTAIEKVHNDPPSRGLLFETSSAEGAILTLPDGAIACDLQYKSRFEAYVFANIENWYRYVNGSLGCKAENGEIRIVIGCDKATSWGMAAVANLTQHKTHYLKYSPVEDSGRTTAPIPIYKWEYTGLAEARVGPDLQEIEDLKRNDDLDVAVEGKYSNQCLFIRTLNPKLDPGIFAAIDDELGVALKQDSQQLYSKGRPSDSTGDPPNASGQRGGVDQRSGTSLEPRTISGLEPLVSAVNNSTMNNDVVRERVTMSSSPSALKSHPADVLNTLLLQKVPHSRVVITQDKDWCSVINEDDEIMPNPSEIAERVLAAYHIREKDGVVFLESKISRNHNRRLFVKSIPVSLLKIKDSQMQKHITSRPLSTPVNDDSPTSSSTSGSKFSHQDRPIGQAPHQSALPVFQGFPYLPNQTFGSGYPSRNEHGISSFRDSHPVMPQYMSMHAPMVSHPSSFNLYTMDVEIERMEEQFINYRNNDSNSSLSWASSYDARQIPRQDFHHDFHQDPSPPSDEETEIWLRKVFNIPAHKAVNLRSLPEEPFRTKGPKITNLIALAIWGSHGHRLTLRQIYDAIEERYPSWKDQPDKPWQRSIRHNLSLKAMFVRTERPPTDPGKGYYWTLNVALGEGNKRDRKRKDQGDDQGIKEEEDADSVSSEGQGYPDTHPLTSSRGTHHRHDTNTAMYSISTKANSSSSSLVKTGSGAR